MAINNCSISILEFNDGLLKIKEINLISHLPKKILKELFNSKEKEVYLSWKKILFLFTFFLTCFLTKITINNSLKNFKKMAFQRDEKIKIVQMKSNRLREMF